MAIKGAGILNQPLNNSTDTTVALNSGNDAVTIGDIVQIDAEQMNVATIISGNNFTVTRAVNGTTIAAHTTGTLVRIGVSGTNIAGAIPTVLSAAGTGVTYYRTVSPNGPEAAAAQKICLVG